MLVDLGVAGVSRCSLFSQCLPRSFERFSELCGIEDASPLVCSSNKPTISPILGSLVVHYRTAPALQGSPAPLVSSSLFLLRDLSPFSATCICELPSWGRGIPADQQPVLLDLGLIDQDGAEG